MSYVKPKFSILENIRWPELKIFLAEIFMMKPRFVVFRQRRYLLQKISSKNIAGAKSYGLWLFWTNNFWNFQSHWSSNPIFDKIHVSILPKNIFFGKYGRFCTKPIFFMLKHSRITEKQPLVRVVTVGDFPCAYNSWSSLRNFENSQKIFFRKKKVRKNIFWKNIFQ